MWESLLSNGHSHYLLSNEQVEKIVVSQWLKKSSLTFIFNILKSALAKYIYEKKVSGNNFLLTILINGTGKCIKNQTWNLNNGGGRTYQISITLTKQCSYEDFYFIYSAWIIPHYENYEK